MSIQLLLSAAPRVSWASHLLLTLAGSSPVVVRDGICAAACACPAALTLWPAGREVAVSRKAAEGILRGAHVFVPGERLQCSSA